MGRGSITLGYVSCAIVSCSVNCGIRADTVAACSRIVACGAMGCAGTVACGAIVGRHVGMALGLLCSDSVGCGVTRGVVLGGELPTGVALDWHCGVARVLRLAVGRAVGRAAKLVGLFSLDCLSVIQS